MKDAKTKQRSPEFVAAGLARDLGKARAALAKAKAAVTEREKEIATLEKSDPQILAIAKRTLGE